MIYSIIVPVYNRPQEIEELLESLSKQTFKNFEVLVIEDGSQVPCHEVIEKYEQQLPLHYFIKQNEGPAMTRNFGFTKINGEYIIFLDSDVIVPPDYLQIVDNQLKQKYSDAFGGPDKAHKSFSVIQKSINYAMTSFITTGGIRGGKKKLDKFYPRSFNMGVSKYVFHEMAGFSEMRFGEDLDFSIRLIINGFTTQLIPNAFVYHKRRANFRQFFKQVHNSGIARIHLYRLYPKSLKLVHTLPAIFTIGILFWFLILFIFPLLGLILPAFMTIIFLDAMLQKNSLLVALSAIIATFVQLIGYGSGFIRGVWNILLLGKKEFQAFRKNFYK
jgi:glycosyltransferase involved in cell wall biosynthesis